MNLIKLTIDGRPVEVEPGQTVLQAARQIGLHIPTLCFLEKCSPSTSCLVCLVKWKFNGQSRMVPACATRVQPGMVIESETGEVHEARRTALELLLSDHVGDCLSPCHRICPLHLNIPEMLRQIQAERWQDAIMTLREALPLPAVLGRLCHHPCENGCRRGAWDQPAAIRDLEQLVAERDLQAPEPWLPVPKASTLKSIAIVGSGPAGLAAAYFLLRHGHGCTVVDRRPAPGGSLRRQVEEGALPGWILDREIQQLERLGLQFRLGVELGGVITVEGLLRGFDAVLLCLGELRPGEAASYGVALAGAALRIAPGTYQTSVPQVFAAGSATRPAKHLVRAMSEGQAAAESIDRFLAGQDQSPSKEFSSMMGRLEKSEVEAFLELANPAPRQSRTCEGCGAFTDAQAHVEAGRCLHCDCRAAGNCRLQAYAAAYGADPNRFREQRRPFCQDVQPGGIIFEPGKCILCGICIQLAEQAEEPLGLTFSGRGFDVRVAAPFHRAIVEGLQKAGAACVEHCPTGALSFGSKFGI